MRRVSVPFFNEIKYLSDDERKSNEPDLHEQNNVSKTQVLKMKIEIRTNPKAGGT